MDMPDVSGFQEKKSWHLRGERLEPNDLQPAHSESKYNRPSIMPTSICVRVLQVRRHRTRSMDARQSRILVKFQASIHVYCGARKGFTLRPYSEMPPLGALGLNLAATASAGELGHKVQGV